MKGEESESGEEKEERGERKEGDKEKVGRQAGESEGGGRWREKVCVGECDFFSRPSTSVFFPVVIVSPRRDKLIPAVSVRLSCVFFLYFTLNSF